MNLKEILSGLQVINDKLIEEGENPEKYPVFVTGAYGASTDELIIELGKDNYTQQNCLIINTDLTTG